MRPKISMVLFLVLTSFFFRNGSAADEPQTGTQYKIIGQLYISAIYLSLNQRQVNKEMAVAHLTEVRFKGPEVAFQRPVTIGTIMTIIGPAPKRGLFSLPWLARRYFVQLEPIDSEANELDVIIQLNRGIEGRMDGLNPALFERRIQEQRINGVRLD